jgi:TonB family protein
MSDLRPAGFDIRAAPAPSAAVGRRDPIDRPVEITSKPSPAYTDEARALKVEGVVRLEVVFLASGEVRVVRVLDGLGHGLDEAAAQAAERIRFQPARAAGVAVDLRTTLHITFRLS